MYESNAVDRMLLAAIGTDGLPFRAIRKLISDPIVLERLCDLGYVWACDPDDGPHYVLSALGREAIEPGRPVRPRARRLVTPGSTVRFSGQRKRNPRGMEQSEKRKAKNEATFRDANEAIERARVELTAIDGTTPFLCECDDASCREIVQLDLSEYERVRASPTTFLIAPGHPHGSDEIVAEHDRYLVVEKQGAAAQVARETNPRVEHG